MGLLQDIVYQLTIRPRQNRLQKLLGKEVRIYPNGSRYVCNPPVMNTDIDFLVLSTNLLASDKALLDGGYKRSTSGQYIDDSKGQPVTCWRKGVVNVVLTGDIVYAIHHQTATHLVKRYNVRDKLLRVAVYELVRGKASPWNQGHVPDLKQTLEGFNGPYGPSMINAYRAKYGLEL